MKKLGRYLKELREKKGLTQSQVAGLTGFESAQMVSNIERGISKPSKKFLLSALLYYGIEKETLIKALLDVQRRKYTKIFDDALAEYE